MKTKIITILALILFGIPVIAQDEVQKYSVIVEDKMYQILLGRGTLQGVVENLNTNKSTDVEVYFDTDEIPEDFEVVLGGQPDFDPLLKLFVMLKSGEDFYLVTMSHNSVKVSPIKYIIDYTINDEQTCFLTMAFTGTPIVYDRFAYTQANISERCYAMTESDNQLIVTQSADTNLLNRFFE